MAAWMPLHNGVSPTHANGSRTSTNWTDKQLCLKRAFQLLFGRYIIMLFDGRERWFLDWQHGLGRYTAVDNRYHPLPTSIRWKWGSVTDVIKGKKYGSGQTMLFARILSGSSSFSAAIGRVFQNRCSGKSPRLVSGKEEVYLGGAFQNRAALHR